MGGEGDGEEIRRGVDERTQLHVPPAWVVTGHVGAKGATFTMNTAV